MTQFDGPRHSTSFLLRFQSRVLAGLVLVIPIWVTYIVVTFVFRLMRDASLWLVEAMLLSSFGQPLLDRLGLSTETLASQGLDALPFALRMGIGVFAVLLTIAALYVFGTIATNVVGRRILRLGESLVERVPIVTIIYHASKKVLETLVGDSARPFQRVVLVPFPAKETSSVGFVTRVTSDIKTGEELFTVFVPTAPNPTTGFVFVVKPSEVTEVDWSAEVAIKIIMSGGVLMPDVIPMVPSASTASPPGTLPS